jgi:hypothetical protein
MKRRHPIASGLPAVAAALAAILATGTTGRLQAQMTGLHGDYREYRKGVHSGNKFRTTFYNDGYFGAKNQPPDIGGEWPINSGRLYMWDADLFVASEVLDADGQVKHIHSTVLSNELAWSIGDRSPSGEPWTFLPLPGFANPDTTLVAMNKWRNSWPYFWPDRIDDPVDPGWAGSWNGYFGKNVFNADEESYSVSDDYANAEFKFYPDSTDLSRRGLGFRMYTRGFQWSNALVEDILFVLYDFENIGTHNHDKVVFAYKFGNNMGQTTRGNDGSDDCGAYLLEEDVAYLWDFDDLGYGGFSPVGYFGGAFLESPGNPFDGIDNDGDGSAGSGMTITEDTFAPKTLMLDDPIVLTDYRTFRRTVTTLREALAGTDSDTLVVPYQDLRFKFWAGKVMQEDPYNLVDDNLNGLIDESKGTVLRQGGEEIPRYLYVGLKAVDYLTGAGIENRLLDERRDDGIDNDGDWDPVYDDTGTDGAPYTYDPGEGDGKPTFGEPHFDKTDIDESDMIGLTSFTLYLYENIPHWDDELVWQNVRPGYLDDLLSNGNVELLYGSGYFPMPTGHIERFSMSIMCGENLQDLLDNKNWAAKAYAENYNFAKAPNLPTVHAVAGDRRVTLSWDDFAEKSVDPLTGLDFEGYRIYRSTDPGFGDMAVVTDGKGLAMARNPIAQFDLVNEYQGYSETPYPGKGVQFWLGTNTGLVHTWTDTTIQNGFRYYYAVTAYDRGDVTKKLAPTETKSVITLSPSGEIEEKGPNVVIVRPEAPAAGYVPAHFEDVRLAEGGTTTGRIGYEIMDAKAIRNGHAYRVTFSDTLIAVNNGPDTLRTKTFSLIDVTEPSRPEPLLGSRTLPKADEKLPTTDGFRLEFFNEDYLQPDSVKSAWASPDRQYRFSVQIFSYMQQAAKPHVTDFRIRFGEIGMDTSVQYYRGRRDMPAVPVNFTVTSLPDGRKIPFAFRMRDGEDGSFTRGQFSDEIILMNMQGDSLVASWDFRLIESADDSLRRNPRAGDAVDVVLKKPFLSNDVFEFTTMAPQVDPELAADRLDRIKVVPNPYIVGNGWEPANPYANGRGPRELHFNHLPSRCTIRIFNSIGQLVRSIEVDNPNLEDGTYIWDMMSRDNLDIAYGIYVYQIDAGKIGKKIGKFAVIK